MLVRFCNKKKIDKKFNIGYERYFISGILTDIITELMKPFQITQGQKPNLGSVFRSS